MARPIKTGLDYYPKDTDMHSDRKIRKLIKEKGANGYLIYDYLCSLIYSDKGYYIQKTDVLAFDVSDFLSGEVTESMVNAVISTCIEVNLFDTKLFSEYSILTSSGIQKRYRNVKRNGIIDKRFEVITEQTGVISAITPVNTGSSTQSKVKEIKVKESKPAPQQNLSGTVTYDAEDTLLKSTIRLEQIIMATGKTKEAALQSLHKYHLYLVEKDEYPKSKNAVFGGFERWLLNERSFSNGFKKQEEESGDSTFEVDKLREERAKKILEA